MRLETLDCLRGFACQHKRECVAPVSQIGIEHNCFLERSESRIVLGLPCQHTSKVGMCLRQVGVELDALESKFVRFSEGGRVRIIIV